MPLDNRNFPFVWMSYDEEPDHDHNEDFEALEASFKHGTPFVILTDNAPTEEHEHSQEEKKRTVLWMKKHKAELRTLVLAMIVIEPSATKRLAMKPFGVAFAKFWGYPMRLTASRAEAMEIAQKLLSKPDGGGGGGGGNRLKNNCQVTLAMKGDVKSQGARKWLRFLRVIAC